MTKRTETRQLVHIALAAVLIAACAWITVPVGPVPFTLQTFGVFCALALLGGRGGTLAVLVYLALGAVGAPVFSGFSGGFGKIVGPTGGYMVGFVAAGLIFWAAERFFGKGTFVRAASMIAGNLACYAFGTAWFTVVYPEKTGFAAALSLCVLPYVIPDLVKIVCALLLAKALKGRIKTNRTA